MIELRSDFEDKTNRRSAPVSLPRGAGVHPPGVIVHRERPSRSGTTSAPHHPCTSSGPQRIHGIPRTRSEETRNTEVRQRTEQTNTSNSSSQGNQRPPVASRSITHNVGRLSVPGNASIPQIHNPPSTGPRRDPNRKRKRIDVFKKRRPKHCSACHRAGHNRNNPTCPLFGKKSQNNVDLVSGCFMYVSAPKLRNSTNGAGHLLVSKIKIKEFEHFIAVRLELWNLSILFFELL